MITGKRLAPRLHNLLNVTTVGVRTLEIVISATLLGLEIDNMLSFNLHYLTMVIVRQGVLKLQRCAAQVIMYADRQASLVALDSYL